MASYDVIVVGGGPAGCAAAARLSESPRRSVCLLEAGRDYGPHAGGGWPSELLDAREITLEHSWPSRDPDRTKLRPRVLGGGSSVNACNIALGAPPDYDWGGDWTFERIASRADAVSALLGVRRVQEDELGDWHRHVLDAARAHGLDAQTHDLNSRGTIRWNTAFAYLDPIRQRPNLTIRAEAEVVRLEPPRVWLATGEELEGRLLVLAAGAYGTAALLLASDLGGEAVGANLSDHPGVALRWPDSADVAGPTTMSQVGIKLRTSLSPDEYWDVRAYSAESGPERAVIVFSMTPASRGSVTVASGELRVDHGFVQDDDVRRLVEAIGVLRAVLGVEAVPGDDADLASYVRENVRGFFHPVGTCAIGTVVDHEGRLSGVDGVAICDASVLPAVPRAPTHLTVLAVAECLAEGL